MVALIRAVPREDYGDLDDRIKALTDEPTLYESYDVVGVVGHARGSRLDLDAAVQSVARYSKEHPDKEGVQDVSQIEVYADHLTALRPVRLPPTCDNMTLIARSAFSQTKPVELEVPGSVEQLVLELHCELTPTPIQLTVTFRKGKTPVNVTIDSELAKPNHRLWEVVVGSDGTTEVNSATDTHTMTELFENSTRSIVDMIQDDGKLAEMGWDKYNNNVRRLLNYQLLLASKYEHQDRQLAYQLAGYVLKLCQGIPKAFDLYSQAGMIASGKMIGPNTLISALVPKIDLSMAQQVLSSRLGAAAAFDSAYRELQGQAANSKNVRLFANIALEKSIDSDQVYSFMIDMAQERLTGARQAFYKAEKEFQTLQLDLKTKQDAFNAGIDAWKTKTALKAIGEVFTAIAAVAGGIALACAVPPAGAGAIGAGAAEIGTAIEAVEGGVRLWQKIKTFAEAIQKVYKKIAPYLEKVKELAKAITAIVDLVKRISSLDDVKDEDVEKLKIPAIEGDDAINITADWGVFEAEMNNLYDGIKDEKIGGASDFFLLIVKMVIRGKAIFVAQTALRTASDAYLIVVQQRIAQKKQTDRLRKAIPQIQGNDKVFDVIKLAMAERLLTLRTWISLDFRQYLAAYAWNCLDARAPILLDPMKDIASFFNDAATLQALSSQVDANVRAQTRVFYLSSSSQQQGGNGALVQADGFLDSLKSSRTASFTLHCESPMFRNYGRIRLSKARLFLEGLGPNEDNFVSIRVTLGASMKDLSLEKTEAPETSLGSVTAPRVLQFATTDSTFGFEYAGGDKKILMDGSLRGRYESSSLLLSPFRTWTLTVDPETKLESISGVNLELTCEATYL